MNRPFAKRFDAPRLSREEAERQGRATNLALKALGNGAAVTFLNTHHDALNGRPIDVAIASADGLLALEKIIAELPSR
jgi:uncharacterized protein (DUF2384 family)